MSLERAHLTLAEALQIEAHDKEEDTPVIGQSLYIDVLAARVAAFIGLGAMVWGWVLIMGDTYITLRIALDFSHFVASFLFIVLPIGMFGILAAWIGHTVGENAYKAFEHKKLLWAFLVPFRLLAIPLQACAKAAARNNGETPEVSLMSLSGSPDAFWQMVQDEEGRDIAVVNRQIFDKASELQSIRVRECMTYRTDVVAVEIEEGIEGLRAAFLSSGYSKVPVYREDLDHVLGYCHSSTLFRKPKHLEDILADILTVPESMTASQLLVELNQAQKSMAVVIDEYGGTSGVVTMEDVMEEIFGEIEDELDEQTEIEQAEDEQTWLLSARLEVDYLNDKYGWDLPTGEYESLGGLVVNLNQDLPEEGDVIEAAPFRFEVVGKEETRITLLRLTLLT